MVDTIKSQAPVALEPQGTKQTTKKALRENFKNLSSGRSVGEALRDAPALVNVNSARNPVGKMPVGKMIDGLHEAVRSSKQTLKALEQVAADMEGSGDAGAVDSFAGDIGQLKSDLGSLLDALSQRAGAAEVVQENMAAADVRLEDVERARAKAESMQSMMRFDSERAMGAHEGLSAEKVGRLLTE